MEVNTHIKVPGLGAHIAGNVGSMLTGAFKKRDKSTSGTKLWQAAEAGDVKAVRKIAKSGFDLETPLEFKEGTAMHIAAQYGKLEVIKVLAEAGAKVDSLNNVHATPLLVAAAFDKWACVRELLALGADVNEPDREGQPALHYAAKRGFYNTMTALLTSTSLDVDIQNKYGGSALMAACEKGTAGTVGLLVKRGADPTLTNESGSTALHWAAEHGDATVVALVAGAARCDVNAQNGAGLTPAMISCALDRAATLQALIDSGRVDWGRRDVQGRSAEDHARAAGTQLCLSMLPASARLST